MAKPKRVPLNRLVEPDTFERVKMLAEVIERSEGEVIDRVVALFAEYQNGGGYQVVREQAKPRAPAIVPADIVSGGLRCVHCPARKFTGSKYLSICSDCTEGGHRGDPRDCQACADNSPTGAI